MFSTLGGQQGLQVRRNRSFLVTPGLVTPASLFADPAEPAAGVPPAPPRAAGVLLLLLEQSWPQAGTPAASTVRPPETLRPRLCQLPQMRGELREGPVGAGEVGHAGHHDQV